MGLSRGLALASSALMVGLAAGCDDGQSAQPKKPGVSPPPIPSSLADGSRPAGLPAGLRRFRGRPVVGARELPEQTAAPSCPAGALGGKPTFLEAWLSTEGLTVEYLVGRGRALFACDAVMAGGRWHKCGGGSARSRNPRRVELAGGALSFCFRPDLRPHYRPFMWIAVAAGTRWALVDHHSYWVAYRAAGRRLLRISGIRGIEGSGFHTRVAYLDGRGRALRERQVTGYVAG